MITKSRKYMEINCDISRLMRLDPASHESAGVSTVLTKNKKYLNHDRLCANFIYKN